eukprot:GILI01039080.1.p1 GENE.GILI01039080.1~~GILI01039080.1.p1  ORF type:complete len:375 (+),score=88.92 GILI01039080.1:136-1125(+)
MEAFLNAFCLQPISKCLPSDKQPKHTSHATATKGRYQQIKTDESTSMAEWDEGFDDDWDDNNSKSTSISIQSPAKSVELMTTSLPSSSPTHASSSHVPTSSSSSSVVPASSSFESFFPSTSLVFMSSGLNDKQQESLARLARCLNARVVDSFDDNVTHVVVPNKGRRCAKRTLKYLFGIVTGKWVIGFSWVKSSLKAKTALPEDDFEIEGDSNGKNGPIRGRTQRPPHGLFHRLAFYLKGNFASPSPTRSDIQLLITLGGGVALSNGYSPTLLAVAEKGLHVVCLCDNYVAPGETCDEKVECLRVSWLLDSVSCFSLLDPSPYLVKAVA